MSTTAILIPRIVHAVNAALLVGATFSNIFVVAPTAYDVHRGPKATIPMEFLIMEGKRLAPWLYIALAALLLSGISMLFMGSPASTKITPLFVAKVLAWTTWFGNTFYGTLVTWPKLQFATVSEAPAIYRVYVVRSWINLGCGVAGIILSVIH